jgi:hypothetical protein
MAHGVATLMLLAVLRVRCDLPGCVERLLVGWLHEIQGAQTGSFDYDVEIVRRISKYMS